MATDASLREAALAVLGLVDPVSPGEVTRAYRRLAKATHPDATGFPQPGTGPSFATINDAYRTLTATAGPELGPATPTTSSQTTPTRAPTHVPRKSGAPALAPQVPSWRLIGSYIAVGPPVVVAPPRIRRQFR